MASSNRNGVRTPFQYLSNTQPSDPKELKRQRDRERYAQNRDEILKRRREARTQKKAAAALVNGDDIASDTPVAVSHGALLSGFLFLVMHEDDWMSSAKQFSYCNIPFSSRYFKKYECLHAKLQSFFLFIYTGSEIVLRSQYDPVQASQRKFHNFIDAERKREG